MRWCIIRTLASKEVLRLLANRGALILGALLIVFALLLAVFDRDGGPAIPLGGLQQCYIDYWQDGPWIEHLRKNVPTDLHRMIKFRSADTLRLVDGKIVYPRNTGAIQIRTVETPSSNPHFVIWIWQPGGDPGVMAPFETWFFRETRRFYQEQVNAALAAISPESRPTIPVLKTTGDPALLWQELHQQFREQATAAVSRLAPEIRSAVQIPELECTRSELGGGFEMRKAVAAALILFALFFSCVFLLPSLTCEERERGLLLAQAISPAAFAEILAGKLVVYPTLGVLLGGTLAAICSPAATGRPFFWLALVVASISTVGLGLSIASLAQTQRAAGMGAMSYTMVVSILIFICQQYQITGLPHVLAEYHIPRMFQAAIDGDIQAMHWVHLSECSVMALSWNAAALVLFSRRGWQ